MLVKIIKTFQDDVNKVVKVEFFYTFRTTISDSKETRYLNDSGNLFGIWIDKKYPQKDTWYDVEIAIKDELVWGRDVITTHSSDTCITIDSTGTYIIQGLLEAEAFDFHTLRIGSSLIALNISGVPEPFSGFIQIMAKQIELYDTNTIN